ESHSPGDQPARCSDRHRVFIVTRAVAANNRERNLRDAAEWHARGERAAAAGRVDDAVDASRRAAVRNRPEPNRALAEASPYTETKTVIAQTFYLTVGGGRRWCVACS